MTEYFDPEKAPYYSPKGDRRVALITGGNSGIGWYTVLHLYLHGYVVYVAGRSPKRVETAIKQIHEEAVKRRTQLFESLQSGEEKVHYLQTRSLGELKFLQMDLLDLKSIGKAVKLFKEREKTLNLLILNAGVMAIPFSTTVDGFEIQMQINYVAHVLLTQLLLELVSRSIDPRIVYLSSIGHNFSFWDFDANSTFNYFPNIIFTWFRYGLAKTYGIQYMKILALKYPEILNIAVHPGFVMDTNLFGYWTTLPIVGTVFWVFFQIFGWLFGVSMEQGALASLKAALSPDLSRENDNGKYFATGGLESRPSYVASNMNYAVKSYTWAIKELKARGYDVVREGNLKDSQS